MRRSPAIFLRLVALAVLAAGLCRGARGEPDQPVTAVVPVGAPTPAATFEPPFNPPNEAASEGTPVMTPAPAAAEEPAVYPAASPAAPEPIISVPVRGPPTPNEPPPEENAPEPNASAAPVPSPTPPSPYSIEIDLTHQRAYLLMDGHIIAESPISSGREGHLTPTGNFEVIEKDLNHFSNLYGTIVETESRRVVKAGADSAMPIPKGCQFVPAPMKWFMRFEGAAGMHAGILPGYAASHGCVRMPAAKAELFYDTVEVGTPVHVFGTAPAREVREEAAPRRRLALTAAGPRAAPVPTANPHHGWWF